MGQDLSLPHLLLLLVGTVEAVHAYRADLDGLSKRLADLAPEQTNTTTCRENTSQSCFRGVRR